MPSAMRTIEQERAEYAWECVQKCVDQAIEGLRQRIAQEREEKTQQELRKRLQRLSAPDEREKWKKNYGSLTRKTPSYILTNGLGQTLAFLKAKGKGDPADEHEVLFSQISNWLKKQLGIGRDDALEWIVNDADSQRYRLATMEALALLQWLKRFAEATLPKGGEE